jgi:hypothetical protein
MPVVHDFPTSRTSLIRSLFPDGVPQLWVPTLVFYDEAGRIDHERQSAHLAFMAPYLKGILVSGSTGDGWDMTYDEVIATLESVIPFAVKHGLDLIVGISRPASDSALALMEKVLDHLRNRSGTASLVDAFAAARVRGLTITAPTSDPSLSQAAIASALTPMLRLGLPITLYQLPQVTGNTMMPELVADLAEEFPNLILFKDSSGTDEVALSGMVPEDVGLLRGAEGRYAHWSRWRSIRRISVEQRKLIPRAACRHPGRPAVRASGRGGAVLAAFGPLAQSSWLRENLSISWPEAFGKKIDANAKDPSPQWAITRSARASPSFGGAASEPRANDP